MHRYKYSGYNELRAQQLELRITEMHNCLYEGSYPCTQIGLAYLPREAAASTVSRLCAANYQTPCIYRLRLRIVALSGNAA